MRLFFLSSVLLFMAVSVGSAKIVFTSSRDGNKEIYAMNDDGSSLRRLTNNPAADIFPLWSPDGRRIVFTRGWYTPDRQQVSDVMIMDADGSGERILLSHDAAFSSGAPRFFTPDGRALAIVRWDLKAFKLRLFLITLEDGTTRPLRGVEGIADADISPDGRFIAFEKNDGFAANIHLVGSDGRGEKALFPVEADPNILLSRAGPQWSPDGSRLIFYEERLDILEAEDAEGPFIDFAVRSNAIVIYNVGSERREELRVPAAFRTLSPCWVSDTQVLFAAHPTGMITKRPGNYEIYHYDLNTGSMTQLTTHPAEDIGLRWIAGPLSVSVYGKDATPWGELKRSDAENR